MVNLGSVCRLVCSVFGQLFTLLSSITATYPNSETLHKGRISLLVLSSFYSLRNTQIRKDALPSFARLLKMFPNLEELE